MSVLAVVSCSSPGPPSHSPNISISEAENLFDPGGLLHCSGLHDMTPDEAEVYLESRGFRVAWQYWTAEEGAVLRRPPADALIGNAMLQADDEILVFAEPPERNPGRPITDCPN
ncbi:MAG: hypothetical protein KG028_04860 [Actinobacteria bacterium]|nr:hypothetical protein [Actinomycetota bacterium]